MRPDRDAGPLRVMVLGAGGQVGRALAAVHAAMAGGRSGPTDVPELILRGRNEIDITHPGAVAAALERLRPHAVVNAAAYTAVDRAESEPTKAFAVNRDAAGDVASACAAAGADLIHLSSDYVFDGRAERPYGPDAPARPLGAYGRSKSEGEARVRAAHREALVLRTSWVFGPWGANFMRTMARVGSTRERVEVVADQKGCPTPADDLARAVFAILRARVAQRSGGVAHFRGAPPASWYTFACEIVARLPDPRPEVVPVSTESYGAVAPRPRYSVLDTSETAAAWGLENPSWPAALDRFLDGGMTRGDPEG